MAVGKPNAAELFGYAVHELKSRSFDQIAHPEDLQLVMERSAECLNNTGREACCTFKLLATSGEPRWVEMRSEAFAWQDRPAILCFLKDMTSQRLGEENYRQEKSREEKGREEKGRQEDNREEKDCKEKRAAKESQQQESQRQRNRYSRHPGTYGLGPVNAMGGFTPGSHRPQG